MSRASRALVASALSAIVLTAAPALARAAESSGTAAPFPAEPSLEQPADPSALAGEASQQAGDQLPATLPDAPSDAPSDAPASAPADPAGEKSVPSGSDAASVDAVSDASPIASATDKSRDAAGATADKPAPATPVAATADDAQKPVAQKADAPAVSPTADDAYYEEDEVVDLYRLYNPNSGEHFYTASAYERDVLAAIGWNNEGLAWKVPTKRGDSVYRLYNPTAGDHHYTLSAYERDCLVKVGWSYEGVGWFSASFGRLPVWRLYNPNAVAGTHHYTISSYEYECVVRAGWNGEDIGFYAVDPDRVRKDPTKDFSHGVASLTANVAAADGSSPQTLRSAIAHDALYLFLPSYADLTKVNLSAFDAAGRPIDLALSGNKTNFVSAEKSAPLDLTSLGATRTDESGLALFVKQGLSALDYIHNLFVMISANISSVFVNSNDPNEDRSFVEASPDHSAKAKVAVEVYDKNGKAVYDKDELGTENLSTIKGRGNMTWDNGDKKPYQISLNKKADLLQTGVDANRNKKWILLANMNDPSLLRNTVAYDLALELGLVGMEGRFVDLFYDGEYRGTYYLCEKVEVKGGRVGIDDLEEALKEANPGVDLESLPTATAKNSLGYEYQYVDGAKDPEDVNGGYIVELDKTYYVSQVCWFDTMIGHFSIKAPEACSKECMEHISVAFQTALENLQNELFNVEGVSSFDLDSFAKSYFVAEFLKNVDSYHSSTYFYVNKGSKTIFSGPVWDYDGSAGIRREGPLGLSHVVYEGFNLWNAGVFEKSTVMRMRLREIFESAISPLLRDVLLGDESSVGELGFLHSLSAYHTQVATSQRMNQVLFGLDGWVNILPAFSTYEDNFAYLRNWLQWRLDWWTRNLGGLATDTEFPSSTHDGFDYSAVFDLDYYLKKNPDVAAAYAGNPNDAIQHFVEYGMREGRVSCRNFDVNAYRARYADLRGAFGDDLTSYYKHYCEQGIYESRIGWA